MGSENIGWQKRKLRDCAELGRDHFKPNEMDMRPYIGLEHIQQQTLRLLSVGKSTDVVSGKYVFKSGDILFGKLRPYFRKVVRPKFEGVCSTDIFVIRSKNGVDQGFFYYLMASEEMVAVASKASEGTKMPRASWNYLQNVDISLPSLPEQRRIASILSAFDDKIELNNQMNRTLEEMASAIFKSWFVDFEPFRDGEFEYSEELEKEILKGWEVKSLYSLSDYINGMAFKQPDFAEEGLSIIKIAELNNGITDNTKLYNGEYKEKYFLKNGDVLFSWSASLGIYLWDGGDAILNQHIFNVKPKETMTKPILYFLLKEIVNEFIQIAAFRATTMGHIKKSHLQEKKIAIADDDTMKTINDLLEPVFEQILANKLENHSLAQIRDILLPKLLSGERRVPINNKTIMEDEK